MQASAMIAWRLYFSDGWEVVVSDKLMVKIRQLLAYEEEKNVWFDIKVGVETNQKITVRLSSLIRYHEDV